eukprot:scaffold283318_cov21-Prasinocladus_malaysianus.AAC.2
MTAIAGLFSIISAEGSSRLYFPKYCSHLAMGTHHRLNNEASVSDDNGQDAVFTYASPPKRMYDVSRND